MNLHLKFAIIASGSSQVALAKRVGIHDTRLSKIVNGHLDPSDAEQRAIAKALRKPVAELFPATAQVA